MSRRNECFRLFVFTHLCVDSGVSLLRYLFKEECASRIRTLFILILFNDIKVDIGLLFSSPFQNLLFRKK